MKNKLLYVLMVSVLFLDMLSKVIIKNSILLGQRVTIIRDVFYLTYVRNTGAAWSILKNNTWIIVILSLIILFGLGIYLSKRKLSKYELIGYGIIIGGSIGNLFDRIVYGYVIDFIDIYIGKYDYPVFNLADSAIIVGVVILFIGMVRGDSNEVNSGE